VIKIKAEVSEKLVFKVNDFEHQILEEEAAGKQHMKMLPNKKKRQKRSFKEYIDELQSF
jgi:hypothetical protein